MSHFLTFEGLDYCGKSTQIRLLEEHIRSLKRSVRLLREPGGTPVGESIRSILLDPGNAELSDESELFLFSASRAQLVKSVIRPLLQEGTDVLCDRFFDSTTAYQGGGRGFGVEAIKVINTLAAAGLSPDATILLDVPLDELEKRMKLAGTKRDRMESNDRAFYDRVRDTYLDLARSEKRIHLLDGMMPVTALAEEIRIIYETLEA